MTTTTLIKPVGTGNFEWLTLDSAQPEQSPSYRVGDLDRLQEENGAGSIIFIAPAEKINLSVASFDLSERKLLRQTVPYALEDELADDVDQLHFALGSSGDGLVDVAVVKKDFISCWQNMLAEQQLEIQAMYSELQLLPQQENCWTLLVKGNHWLLRHGDAQGFAVEEELASLALQLLLDESDTLPEHLLVYAADSNQAQLLNKLPELLRGIVVWQDDNYWDIIARGFRQNADPINLLQGDYAQSLPWKKWWQLWRVGLIILASAVVLNILLSIVRIQLLEGRNLDLRSETERVYRSVVPRGAVMQPAIQLQRKVQDLRSEGGEGFVSQFERVSKQLALINGVQLQSINYNQKQAEILLTIIANGFNDVETARAKLESVGFEAKLTGSSTEGDKTRARLRVRS